MLINDCNIVKISKADYGRIEPMWHKINRYHVEKSVHFKEQVASFGYERRMAPVLALDEIDLNTDLVEFAGKDVGYCISCVRGDVGEIESLYLDSKCRGWGLGSILLTRAIKWLKSKGCQKIQLSVGGGNEEVFDFYRKFGFEISSTVLRLK